MVNREKSREKQDAYNARHAPVETYKLFAEHRDPASRMRGELIGCFSTLEKAIATAKEMGMEHFSIKLNNAQQWEW